MLVAWFAKVNVRIYQTWANPHPGAVVGFVDFGIQNFIANTNDLIIFDEQARYDVQVLRWVQDTTIFQQRSQISVLQFRIKVMSVFNVSISFTIREAPIKGSHSDENSILNLRSYC